jgi:hypothetical protein
MTVRRPGLARRLLHRVWYVHPSVVLLIQAPPSVCLQTLIDAARPSQQRLHLRDLFTEGRRYYLHPLRDGFQLTSNSKVPWRRGRTSIAAVLFATLSASGDDATRIYLRSRMSIPYLLSLFLVPVCISSVIIFARWPTPVIVGVVLALFGLSWIGHRLNARLQAGEMVFFVQKALDDLASANIPLLAPTTDNVVTVDREFREQWQKFYEEHKGD